MALGVDEASEAYERAMRNIVAAGPGICRVCWGFIDPDYKPVPGSGETCGDILGALPAEFDWATCAVHEA